MNKYIILGHENPDNDSIVSGYLLEKLMKQLNYDVEFIIPDNINQENIALAAFCGIDPTIFQKHLPTNPNIKYILVDHHERTVPGEIVAIIDHHPTTATITLPYYLNVPSSSASLLITKTRETYFDKNDLKAACFSAMVDTAAFHSNKTVEEDVIWVQDICRKYGFNYNELLTTSMQPTNMSNLDQAALNGQKNHLIQGHNVSSSFLHLPDPKKSQEDIDYIIEFLTKYRAQENLTLFALLVHDITSFQTTLYKIYSDKITTTHYPTYTSRGNKIIPDLDKELSENPKIKQLHQ